MKISRERVFELLNSKIDQNTQFPINFGFIASQNISSEADKNFIPMILTLN